MMDFDLTKRTQERRETLLHEADEWRLAKLATDGRPRHTLPHSRLMVMIGTWLITLGSRLRSRYGELELTAVAERMTGVAE